MIQVFLGARDLEKHSDVQSDSAIVGNGLRHMVKRITVVFPQPFILAPLIHQIHVNLNKSKVFQMNEYLLTVRSVDKKSLPSMYDKKITGHGQISYL